MSLRRKDQYRGCLIGLCVGDAVGFPVEGYPPTICQRYVEQVLKTGMNSLWSHYPYPFGQYSDDSQLTRELVKSYVQCNGFNPEDYAQRIAGLFQVKKIVGHGRSTQKAAQRLIQGLPWRESGEVPPNAGNGSAMRAAPLGLFYAYDPDQLVASARDQSYITHQDPRCLAGSAIIAGAVALALNNTRIQPEPFLDQLIQWTSRLDAGFAQNLEGLKSWLIMPPEEAFGHIVKAGVEPEYEATWPGISPFVVSSVLWSLYAFLRSPEDYWETICLAVIVGGDVDTTAAIAGAISGAHLGLEAVPSHVAQRLVDQGTWGYPQLLGLIDQAYAINLSHPNGKGSSSSVSEN